MKETEHRLYPVPMGDVTLRDPYEVNAFEKELAYLRSLDADRLLKGFCQIGRIPSDARLYGGWEDSAIRGHTMGHYLTALSQAYAACGQEDLKQRVRYIISVLARCQDPATGYLAAIPESHYIQLEEGRPEGTWVPWYSMHKILSGLLSAHTLTGNAQALHVASRLGDWVSSRTSRWDETVRKTVLQIEYGGMNDCLYTLYSLTGQERHLCAAHSFDELSLFEPLSRGQDVLCGRHANTTIPKLLGAVNRCMVLGAGEEFYLRAAENFWEMVVSDHSYITGGNSQWEHFGQPGILDAERTNCNCETCNTYNMLKLSRRLFMLTGKRRYADYYENTFVNAILSSQNPQTGMTMYFQPMATGYFKVYSSPEDHFWCCTGSGMESFTKLGDSIYYQDASSLYITRYTASAVRWKAKNLVLTVEADLPMTDTVRITLAGSGEGDIVLRIPDWCAERPAVSVNGTPVQAEPADGFLRLHGLWRDGDTIFLRLPMQITVHPLPDNPHAAAFKYGPVVLSADLGGAEMTTGTTGVNVTVPHAQSTEDMLFLQDGTVAAFFRGIGTRLVRKEGTLEFALTGTQRELTFLPHYRQHHHRYGIYFRFADGRP